MSLRIAQRALGHVKSAGLVQLMAPIRTHRLKAHAPNLRPSRGLAVEAELLKHNREWAAHVTHDDPQFFEKLAKQQAPKGLMPGEVFVHRNVANVVVHSDLNCLSTLQYAIEVLKVEHIIVCGHYGCGGVARALDHTQMGLIDNWIRHIKDIARRSSSLLDKETDRRKKEDLLVELNVRAQVENVCHTTIVQNAWRRGQNLRVHGWVYSLENGLINQIVKPSIKGLDQVEELMHMVPLANDPVTPCGRQ